MLELRAISYQSANTGVESIPLRSEGTGGGGRSSRRVSSSALDGGVNVVDCAVEELEFVTPAPGDVFSRS